LDRDERTENEVQRLHEQLGERLWLWERREIDNYLLDCDAILAALRDKTQHSDAARRAVALTAEQIRETIDAASSALFQHVLVRRIRARLQPPRDGLLPRAELDRLSRVPAQEFGEAVVETARATFGERASPDQLANIVEQERALLETMWQGREHELAPGEELLTHAFSLVDARYDKRRDGVRIVRAMPPESCPEEVVRLLSRVSSLTDRKRWP
jgi:hypothetical protein